MKQGTITSLLIAAATTSLAVASLYAVQPEKEAEAAVFAYPAVYAVTLATPDSDYSGTESRVWFRLLSEQSQWGSWHSIDGIERGESVSVQVTEPTGFVAERIQVYIGQDDGARINLAVTSPNIALKNIVFNKWIKNGAYLFDLAEFEASLQCDPSTGSCICTDAGSCNTLIAQCLGDDFWHGSTLNDQGEWVQGMCIAAQ